MCSYQQSLKAEGIDKVTVAQPIAIILKMHARAEFTQAWETVYVMLDSENKTKKDCGHYK